MGSSPGVTPTTELSTKCELECTTVKSREALREEYFKTYDVMTGIRIAATLGGMIVFLVLFLLYKTKCKRRHRYQTRKKDTEDVGIEYKVEGVNNVKDSIHSEGFHSYAHFQARCSDVEPDTLRQVCSGACGNQAPIGAAHLSVMEEISYVDNNCCVDEIRIQIRTPTPSCEAPQKNIFTWDNEQGACGGVACSSSAQPLCELVPGVGGRIQDTSETKC